MKTSKRRTNSHQRFLVTTDGEGVGNHVGSVALRDLGDALGLTRALSGVASEIRQRRSAYDPGQVIRDLVVMIADGGDCVSDLAALREQPDLFGRVASTATAWRLVDGMSEKDMERMREARRVARAQAWKRGGAPKKIVLDLDATLVTAHSEKENAAANYKRGFGLHPLLCYLEGFDEALAGKLRAGNATANDGADNIEVLEMALHQLPKSKRNRTMLVRADSSGATHILLDRVRELGLEFSVGMDLYESVREAILNTAKIPAVVAAAGLTPLNTGFVPLFRSVALRSATTARRRRRASSDLIAPLCQGRRQPEVVVQAQLPVDDLGQLSFETPESFIGSLVLRQLALVISPAEAWVIELGSRHQVKSEVQRPVAVATEPMALDVAA